MHVLLAAVLALQAATVIDVQANHAVTLALQFGDTIYTAEFSRRDLKAHSLNEWDRVQAEVKGGRMTVQRKGGRRVLVRPGHSGAARAHSSAAGDALAPLI